MRRASPRAARARPAIGCLALAASCAALAGDAPDLASLPLEELMNVQVVSASRKAEPYASVAAAVFVLTGNDLRRLGVANLPDALRLVPGVQVGQTDANTWAVSARGSNGQFANKLLVMIDGRSVYTPSFSGVYWDLQNLPIDEIERIEVIRGPGGAVWGANAVNGVINVITRAAAGDPGGLVELGIGTNADYLAAVRWAGRVGSDSHLRVFANGREDDGLPEVEGPPADDGWRLARGGFRFDTGAVETGALTVDGDLFDGSGGEPVATTSEESGGASRRAPLSGGHVRARWERGGAQRGLSAQVFADRFQHDAGVAFERRTTWDAELQGRFTAERGELVAGASYRRSTDECEPSTIGRLEPAEATLDWIAGFAQGEFRFEPANARLLLGVKAEHNDYTGWELQPTVRAAIQPASDQTIWIAYSSAVRTPSRAARGLVAETRPVGAYPLLLRGSDAVDSEQLSGYEAGYRLARARWSLDLAAFRNDYRDLEIVRLDPANPIVEPIPEPPFFRVLLPANFESGGDGHASGFEFALDVRPSRSWRVVATGSWLSAALSANDDLARLREPVEDSPKRQFSLISSHDFGRLEIDATFRYVDELPESAWLGEVLRPRIPAYSTADLRIAVRAGERFELVAVGRNLLESGHTEFGDSAFLSPLTSVERSAYLQARFRF